MAWIILILYYFYITFLIFIILIHLLINIILYILLSKYNLITLKPFYLYLP